MELELIKGQFSGNEALELLTKMVQVKQKFHESKIEHTSNEEDIKYRESRLKHLQNQLAQMRNELSKENAPLQLNAVIQLQKKPSYETENIIEP